MIRPGHGSVWPTFAWLTLTDHAVDGRGGRRRSSRPRSRGSTSSNVATSVRFSTSRSVSRSSAQVRMGAAMVWFVTPERCAPEPLVRC